MGRNDNGRKKELLRTITAKTINQLLLEHDFITPSLYHAAFHIKAKELGVNIECNDTDEDLESKILLIQQCEQNNVSNLEKLNTYVIEAKSAIEDKNKQALEKTQNNIEALMQTIQIMKKELYHDEITGLFNRKGLFHAIASKERRMKEGGGLFVFDMDNFKNFNDTYGHAIGDAVLKAFAQNILKRATLNAKTKHLARLGGDEFVVVVDCDNMEHVKIQLERIQAKGLQLKIKGEKTETIEFSFGKQNFKEGDFYDHIFIEADKQMYNNKQNRKKAIA